MTPTDTGLPDDVLRTARDMAEAGHSLAEIERATGCHAVELQFTTGSGSDTEVRQLDELSIVLTAGGFTELPRGEGAGGQRTFAQFYLSKRWGPREWSREVLRSNLNPTTRVVALALAQDVNPANDMWVTVQMGELGKALHMGPGSIRGALRTLEELGWLHPCGGNRSQGQRIYELRIPADTEGAQHDQA